MEKHITLFISLLLLIKIINQNFKACIDVKLTVTARTLIGWKLASCSSASNLRYRKKYQQKCCIVQEEATLICDTSADARDWDGGSLDIYGHTFCDVFNRKLMIKLHMKGIPLNVLRLY